jgi:hypothetical protein
MSASLFMSLLGAVCVALLVLVCRWQRPGRKLTPADTERYLKVIEGYRIPEAEKAGAIRRIREWAANDDGRPFYMLNLMRYYDELRRFPGAPAYEGTPRQANAYYESIARKLLLKSGSYPIIGGRTLGRDILEQPATLDDWDRVLVVRYRNRRAFLELITDPAYGPVMPYKLMSLDVVLVPVTGDLLIPDLRLLAGVALLALFLAAGWWSALGGAATVATSGSISTNAAK